jgi:hypothetical protein
MMSKRREAKNKKIMMTTNKRRGGRVELLLDHSQIAINLNIAPSVA